MTGKDNKIRNVGPKSAAWLRQVGVRTHEDLLRVGPVEAFLNIKRAGFRPSLNLLYALAGAEQGCHWTALPLEEKQRLVTEAGALEDAAKAAKSFVMPARDVTPPRDDKAEEPMQAPALFDEPDAAPDEQPTTEAP